MTVESSLVGVFGGRVIWGSKRSKNSDSLRIQLFSLLGVALFVFLKEI